MNQTEETIFNNDPIYMKSLVGKEVELVTVEDISHTGIVYVIDPIYKTTVLHTNRQSVEKYDTVFVMFHAIKSFNVLSHTVDENYLKNIEPAVPGNNSKKKILKKWLEHMFINVAETGDYLKVDDHLVIVPPYGPQNCICNNTIILDRIRKIISLMPSDFK